MLKTLNTTNTIFQIIAAELETQPTQTITTSSVAQEVTPTTKIQKTTKTPKKAAKATIKSTFKSFTTQHGYFVPSILKPNITHTTHTTTLIISTITIGYFLTCKVNGVQQVSVIGDDCHTDWKLKLQAGDLVEVEVLGGKTSKTITYTINQDGVSASASEGINHSLKGNHKADLDIQDKYRKEAVAAPAQEETAQIEEETVEAPAPAQETVVEAAPVAQQGQIINFGKHTGEAVSSLSSSYLKWIVSHESTLHHNNRWACTAAKAILAARQAQEEQRAA